MFESINNFKENYLSLDKWAKWYISFVVDFPNRNLKRNLFDNPIDFDDDIAVEVLTYRKQLTDFGESAKTRSPRPSNVKYRVGQVIKHKNFDLYGVIIGWDLEANAPTTWLKRNYNELDVIMLFYLKIIICFKITNLFKADRLVKQPHYLILVDEKFQKKFTGKAYIAQEHIEIVSNYKVKLNTNNKNSFCC